METLNISFKSLWKIVAVIAIIGFLWAVRDVIAIIFFAIIISSAMAPAVNKLENFRIPRAISALGLYLIVFGLIGVALSVVLPPLARELFSLLGNLRDNPILLGGSFTIDQLIAGGQAILKNVLTQAGQGSGSVFAGFSSVLGGLASVVFTLVISFYLTIEDEGIKGLINSILPEAHRPKAISLMDRTQKTLGRWLKGQLVLGIIVGALVFLGLYILGNKYALSLGVLAGILELIPYLGPLLAAVPGVLIAFSFSQDLFITALTLGWYVIVQQFENHAIVPLVIGKAVNLDPILVLLAVLIGGKIGGFAGIVLAVPIAALLAEFIKGSTGFDLKLRSHRAKKN